MSGNKGKDWDDRERERTGKEVMEEVEHISELYLSLVEEYANLNHLRMFEKDDNGYYSMRIYDPRMIGSSSNMHTKKLEYTLMKNCFSLALKPQTN